MLTDANGDERKGIEVLCQFYRKLTVPSRKETQMASILIGTEISLFRREKTIRDLMLAGF